MEKNYFSKERLALKFLGLSLTGNESRGYRIYSAMLLVSVNFTYPVLAIMEIFKHEYEVVVDMMFYEFGLVLGSSFTGVVLLNRIKFGKILDRLQEEPFTPNVKRGGEKEEELIKDCVGITNMQTLICWTSALISFTCGASYTIFRRITSEDYHDWQFNYGPLTILNVTRSPNYEISLFYQNLSVLCIAFHFISIDLLAASALAHISCQFRILQNNLKRIVDNSYRDMQKNKRVPSHTISNSMDYSIIPLRYLNKALKEAMDYHLAIIAVANEMEEVFSTLLLVVFLGTMMMFCFIIYKASLLSFNDIRMIRNMAELTSTCMQVFMICYWGEQVAFDSEQVGRAAYEANFSGTNVRFQKSIAFIIRRTENPTKLTAGKLGNICLATFTWILRTAYSAFMVLRNSNVNKM